jgi:hypothetical protein
MTRRSKDRKQRKEKMLRGRNPTEKMMNSVEKEENAEAGKNKDCRA